MSLTSVVLSCLLVLAILIGEHLCELGSFTGMGIKIGSNLMNNSNTRQNWTGNLQEWPALGQTHVQTTNNFRKSNLNSNVNTQNNYVGSQSKPTNNERGSTLSNHAWPALGGRTQVTNWRNTQNHHWPYDSNPFTQSQVQRGNSYLNSDVSYASHFNNNQGQSHNVRPQHTDYRATNNFSTGIKFGDQSEFKEVKSQHSPSAKRTNANEVTDNELREFSEQLLSQDTNNAAKYVTVNFQGRTTSRSKNDEAPLPLLEIGSGVYNIPTIAKLLPLYDNYIVKADVNEDYTNQEKDEENALLRAVLDTDVMKATKNFLIEKGSIRNEREFQNLLHDIWFHQYSRGKRKVGSSGFEHVFLAEIKNNDVSGLHNWLYFGREEANRRSNYLGFLKKIDLGGKGAILKFNFDFHGINKPVGSMFIGTSPEFEMALYSTCFILRADKICPLKLNGNRFIIRTYTYQYDGKKLIGSAFAEL